MPDCGTRSNLGVQTAAQQMESATWRLSFCVMIMAAAASMARAATPLKFEPIAVVHFTQGDYLEDLASAQAGKLTSKGRKQGYPDMELSLVAAKIVGPVNRPDLRYSFYAYAFKDWSDGSTFLHGPLLTLPAGSIGNVIVHNELSKPVDESFADYADENGYRLPTHSNLHLHGLWSYGGIPEIPANLSFVDIPYIGMGDDVFLNIPPKPQPGSPAAFNTFNYVIEPMHLPGTHWYHPHWHGSASVQVQSASGPILVTSDVKYLTADRGCLPLSTLLAGIQTRILYFQAFLFEDADIVDEPYNLYDKASYNQISDDTTPPYQALPNNPLCCNTSNTGYGFNATHVNVALVNGGLQPIIRMTPNVPQLWRMWNAQWKGYMDLNIIRADGLLAPCKFHLMTKDGVYLMEIPRLVDDLVMAAANRAEVIVECDGDMGDRYYLASGAVQNFGPAFPYQDDPDLLHQANIAVIELASHSSFASLEKLRAAGASPSAEQASLAAQAGDLVASALDAMKGVPNEGCTPKRPSYAADLRGYQLQGNLTLADASLNTTRKLVFLTENNPYGCTINDRNFSIPTQDPLVLPLGQVLEIQYINEANHPVHLHDQPQQITRLYLGDDSNGTRLSNYFKVGDWGDTFKLPQLGEYDTNTEHVLTTRLQPGPFNGYTVLHCHFLHHQDSGCMSMVQKPCPEDPYPGPDAVIEYPCATFQFPVQGDFGNEEILGTAGLPVKRYGGWLGKVKGIVGLP